MFVDADDIGNMDTLYGPARRIEFAPIPMKDFEYRLLIDSMTNGRRHDVTMFIELDGGYVGIQKPMYSGTGIFRAPSGGLKPGETLETGLKREVAEETGLSVAVDKFLLIVNTEFIGPAGDRKAWTSYVFSGPATGGALKPTDLKEISGIRLVTREEMLGPIADEMEKTGMGGFVYRSKLTRETFRALDERIKGQGLKIKE